MKAIVIYYSLSGNTETIAEDVQKATNSDMERVETRVPYKGSYDDIVQQGQEEIENGFCPEINPLKANLSEYDTIILGTPVWWHSFAPAMHSFLKEQNLAGKNIYLFATNGGWLGHTRKDFHKLLKGSDIKGEISIRFDGNTLKTSRDDIQNWISGIH